MARRTVTTTRTRTVAQTETAPEGVPAPEKAGMSFYDALILSTTVLLLAAFLMTDYIRGTRFGEGLFFS